MNLVIPNKMCLKETYRIVRIGMCVRGGPNQPLHRDPQWSIVLVRIGKYLSDNFPIQNGLKQGDALSPPLFNFALEYAIRKA
jgi:hypothetical protein